MAIVLLKLLIALLFATHNPCQRTRRRTTKDIRPFYPEYFFSIIEPNMEKHHTAHYGDYRYFDVNYEYTIAMDFYRYGATEVPDYSQDPAHIAQFSKTKSALKRYWKHYKFYYELDFQGEEDAVYFKIFKHNLALMKNLSEKHLSANFRINPWTHIDLETFTRNYTGYDDTDVKEDEMDYDAEPQQYSTELERYPKYLDWSVYKGEETPSPISQMQCKFSYVFSAMHSIELHLLRETKTLAASRMMQLSYQQGYDCSDPKRTCDSKGGKPHYVFRGLRDQYGVYKQTLTISESEGPILPNYTCEWHTRQVLPGNGSEPVYLQPVLQVIDYGLLEVDNEFELMLALNEYGPLCTTIYVSEAVKNYHSGVLTEKECDKPPNHAVLLVGYSTTKDKIPYWIIKNSWGPSWGQKGFMLLIRNKKACGIGEYISYVIISPYTTSSTTTTTRTTTTLPCDKAVESCGVDSNEMNSTEITTPADLTNST